MKPIAENKMFTTFTDLEFDGKLRVRLRTLRTFGQKERLLARKYARDSYWPKFNQNNDTWSRRRSPGEFGQD